MKKIYSFLIALVIGVIAFGVVVHFNQPVVIAPETPDLQPSPTILSQTEIEHLLDIYAYCTADEDCTSFYAECPFGCAKGIHVNYLETAQTLIEDFRQHQLESNGEICVYDCAAIQGTSCQSNKCIAHTESPSEEVSYDDE